jgi:hypothetical protein
VQAISNGWRLTIPASEKRYYRIAQLDNCTRVARRAFAHQSMDMRLRARVSSQNVQGTWGFGVWNDPYRTSTGPGENILQTLTLPNAAWYFSSSKHSHLAFRDDKPANGFLAQVFRAEKTPWLPLMGVAGLFLFSRARARRSLSHLIEEEALRLEIDVTQWHEYRMNWDASGVVFEVDEQTVLQTPISPKGRLGTVIWIDNQFAAFTPEGKVKFGALTGPEEWMEISDLRMESGVQRTD